MAVLADGHVDVAARLAAGRLLLQVKDGTAGPGAVVWRAPDDVVFHVRPAAATAVPAAGTAAFLGAPGAPLWLLPQVQRSGLLWPGWNTEELDPEGVAGDVAWTLTGVEGPGRFALFTTGTFGAVDRLFDSGDGLPDTRAVARGVHAHGSWAFTAPGRYRLAFALRARTPAGRTLDAAEALVVTVGDVDPETGAPLPGDGGAGRDDGSGGGGASGGAGRSGGGDGAAGSPGSPPDAGGEHGAGQRDDDAGRRAAPPLLRTGRARLRGRLLAVRLRVRVRSRVRVVVRPRRGGRGVVAARRRVVAPRARRLRARLPRRLAPGRYRVLVRARSRSGRTQTRAVALRVRRPRGARHHLPRTTIVRPSASR